METNFCWLHTLPYSTIYLPPMKKTRPTTCKPQHGTSFVQLCAWMWLWGSSCWKWFWCQHDFFFFKWSLVVFNDKFIFNIALAKYLLVFATLFFFIALTLERSLFGAAFEGKKPPSCVLFQMVKKVCFITHFTGRAFSKVKQELPLMKNYPLEVVITKLHTHRIVIHITVLCLQSYSPFSKRH